MASLTSTGVRFAVGDELTSKRGIFPTSTAWVFCQASSPTGWTKSITHNNKALRVVSGTGGGSGGTNAFTTTMSSFVVGGPLSCSSGVNNHPLAEPQIPSHDHGNGGSVKLNTVPALYNPDGFFIGWSGGDVQLQNPPYFAPLFTLLGSSYGNTGTGDNHSHPFSANGTVPNQPVSLAVQYVDIIISTFDG